MMKNARQLLWYEWHVFDLVTYRLRAPYSRVKPEQLLKRRAGEAWPPSPQMEREDAEGAGQDGLANLKSACISAVLSCRWHLTTPSVRFLPALQEARRLKLRPLQ